MVPPELHRPKGYSNPIDRGTGNRTVYTRDTKAKATAEHTAQTLDVFKSELMNTAELIQRSAANIQQNGNIVEEAKAAAKDATEVDKRRWRWRKRSETKDNKSRQTDQ